MSVAESMKHQMAKWQVVNLTGRVRRLCVMVVDILDEIYSLPHEPSSWVCGLQVSLKGKTRLCRHGRLTIGLCNKFTVWCLNLIFARYKSSFGDDYFSFWCGGVRFLVLNTQYFEDASKVPELAQKHEQWLNEELEFAKQAGSRVIVFQHIPWFVKDPNEEANYFSIKPSIRHVWLENFKNSGKCLINWLGWQEWEAYIIAICHSVDPPFHTSLRLQHSTALLW